MKPATLLLAALTLLITILVLFLLNNGKATYLEAFAFITGALCVWLTVKESAWNFPISLINVAAFCVLYFNSRLLADASLQIVYFVLTIMGWYLWLKGGERHTKLRISRSTHAELATITACVIALTFVLWQVLHALGGSATFLDAFTTALSLAAQWLLNYKRLENWIFWIIADLVYIPLYFYKALYLTSLLYFIFLIMATIGLLQWHATWRKQKPSAAHLELAGTTA
jgi:nicotinamide mononucleotide transporter